MSIFGLEQPWSVVYAIGLALAGFELTIGFVDHVKATFTAHKTVFPVATAQRFKRISNFHDTMSVRLILTVYAACSL